MAEITYTKLKYSDIPEKVHKAVTKMDGKNVIFDDTGLNPTEKKSLEDWLAQEGYKQV